MDCKVILFLILCLCAVTVHAAAGEASVTRSISDGAPSPGSTCEVTLVIENLQVGGIVETFPDGFTLVSCSLPDDRVRLRGQAVAFAVTDDESITYVIHVPDQGSGDISGSWEDFLNDTSGTIPAVRVAVNGEDGGAPVQTDPEPTRPEAESPGFGAVLAACGAVLGAAYAACGRGRR
jgi:hypothetical protein